MWSILSIIFKLKATDFNFLLAAFSLIHSHPDTHSNNNTNGNDGDSLRRNEGRGNLPFKHHFVISSALSLSLFAHHDQMKLQPFFRRNKKSAAMERKRGKELQRHQHQIMKRTPIKKEIKEERKSLEPKLPKAINL
jgi:hypothetical protein